MTLAEMIKARLKVLYPEVTLSQARIKAIAEKLSAKQLTVDQETEVDAALNAMNDNGQYTFAELQKEDNRVLQLQILANKGKPEKQTPPKKEDEPDQVPDDTPAWAKSLIESNKTLSEKLAAIEGKERTTSIKSTIAAKLKEVPSSYWEDWAIPDKDEDVGGFVEKVNTKYTAFTKDLTDKGLSLVPTPGGGNVGVGDKKASEKEIEAVLNNII